MAGAGAAIATVAVIAATAAPALADQPIRDESSSSVSACGTTLTQEIAFDGEKTHIFSDTLFRVTGVLFIRYTNPDTGASVLLNVSGPAWFHVLPDGTVTLDSQGLTGGVGLDGLVNKDAGPGEITDFFGSNPQVTISPAHVWEDYCAVLTS